MSEVRVKIQATPNPDTMKFEFSIPIAKSSVEFAGVKEAVASPLAQKIFGFPWVSRVFIGPEFVTITKQDWVDWDIIAEPLSDLLKEHLDLGEPVISDTASLRTEYSEDDTPEIRLIKETLDRYIRPVVAMDGGDITFSDFKDDVVYLKMTGACNGCPSSTQTLKEGVEVKLKEVLPSIKEIVAVPNAN